MPRKYRKKNRFEKQNMKKKTFSLFSLLLICASFVNLFAGRVRTGADQTDKLIPLLEEKRVAMMVNQTSVLYRENGTHIHLVDSLISAGINLSFLMCPEHGLEGNIGAGYKVGDSRYAKLQSLPIRSLYGKNKKPQPEWLKECDVVVFDVQDVGCRFYTYISTLFYVLQACGEQQIPVIVLDRPNPNDTIDGPMLREGFSSFVGIVPVPLLHGCTLGEMAQMMIGERWIGDAIPELTVIKCEGWKHGDPWSIQIAPSPNLPNDHAIRLYPSLCLFEGTKVSVGRGTSFPFEVFGHPRMKGSFSFTPKSNKITLHPLQENVKCFGKDLRKVRATVGFDLQYLIHCSKQLGKGWITETRFFDLLAGSSELRQQLDKGMPEKEIRESWQAELNLYRNTRQKYVLYESKD